MLGVKLTPSIKQQQRLTMSPAMIQSIALMSMPAAELREHIYEEAEKNPALEIVRDTHFESPYIRVKSGGGSSSASDDYQAFIESRPDTHESLHDFLMLQLAIHDLTPFERETAEKIINNLDSRGFYSVSPAEMMLSCSEQQRSVFHRMIDLIQSFDPPGICVADIRESLLIQALRHDDVPPAAVLILRHFFDALEKPRAPLVYKKITAAVDEGLIISSEAEDLTVEDVEDGIDFIRTLDPYPARDFSASGHDTAFVSPDIYVRRASEEERSETGMAFIAETASGTIPDIAVSPVFTETAESFASSSSKKTDDAKFITESVREARRFIDTVRQREATVYKIAAAVLEVQQPFFEHGPRFLSPLRMKDIADRVGVHEATVSRIANGKYIQCEWGLFEIKYFFSNSVAPANIAARRSPSAGPANTGRSKESVKEELRLLIEQEGSNLSDEKLSKLLASRGVKIARRTVAKYRAELSINSSYDR